MSIMKKKYISPKMTVYKTKGYKLLSGSGMNAMQLKGSAGYEDIVYGGVDEEGEVDPD